MSIILYGKPVAESIINDLSERTKTLLSKGVQPAVSILRAGARSDDIAYEKRVANLCEKINIKVNIIEMPEDVSQQELEDELAKANEDQDVHGILVFRPLPSQIDENRICSMISPQKDIDCMNSENLKKLFMGDSSGIAPCTPEAVIEILKHYNYKLEGKNVVIVNRSMVIGKPLSMLFLNENSTVTICHSRTVNLKEITKSADIIVSGVGRAKYFGKEYVSENSTVIDVGINFAEGRMCGDLDFDTVNNRVGAITPVPGGVGTVTSAILLKHLLESAENSI